MLKYDNVILSKYYPFTELVMRASVDTLPHSCVLTLCTGDKGRYPLAEALRQALRSAQRSVWVDCRQVVALPTEALALLRRCARLLWQHGGHLILCHLPDGTQAALATDASQPLASSVLDAAQYGLDCPQVAAA